MLHNLIYYCSNKTHTFH